MDNEKLNELVELLVNDIKGVREFTIEQAPEVVQQMVIYHMVISWIGVILGLIGMVLSVVIIQRKLYPYLKEEGSPELAWLIGIVVVGFMSVPSCASIGTAIMTTFTPKYFILKQLAEMI